MSGVPDYNDGGTEEEDIMSLKEMISAMRSEFRVVSKKVDSFEHKLSRTQENVEQLSEQLETAAEDQEI